MDLDGRRESTNVEDRRGMSGGAKAGLGGGIIGIIIAMVFAFMGGGNGGIDLGSVIGQMGNITQEQQVNEQGEVQMIAILRGGGSADDLACFNDETLVREIAASRIPVITGIGHEVDESLADLAADIKASTPSNVAQMLTRDRATEIRKIETTLERVKQVIINNVNNF